MKRRTVLATACTSLAGFTGCSSGAPPPGTRPSSPPPLAEFDCPPHDSNPVTVVCSHTVDTESANVYLLPSAPTIDAATRTLELTLHNNSTTELAFNPYQWTIMRKATAGWEPVEQRLSGDGRLTLPPGETQTWTFQQVMDFINENVTANTGTYTASINVPNPADSDWIRCLALFRLV